MGEDKLVNNIRAVVNQIIKEKGKINLFMLLKDEDDEMDTHTVLISAAWLNSMDAYDGTRLIVNYLRQSLSTEDINRLSRITVVNSEDYQVINIIRGISTQGGMQYLNNCYFGNVIIPSAILYESVF